TASGPPRCSARRPPASSSNRSAGPCSPAPTNSSDSRLLRQAAAAVPAVSAAAPSAATAARGDRELHRGAERHRHPAQRVLDLDVARGSAVVVVRDRAAQAGRRDGVLRGGLVGALHTGYPRV